MKILHWNCQGLGSPLTISNLKDIRKSSKPDIMLLVETKNVNTLSKELGYAHSFVVNPNGLSGGLAIFWDDNVQIDFLDEPALYCTDMYVTEGVNTFFLFYIYGNPVRKYRNALWNKMISLGVAGLYQDKSRLVLGDFNDIKGNHEKLGGPIRSEASFAPFRNMLSVCGLHDLKVVGGKYT